MAEKKHIDWEAVRRDFETGSFSNTELSEKYGCSRALLHRHRRNEGWTQDNSERVRAIAATIVNESEATGVTDLSRKGVTPKHQIEERIVVEAAAQAQAIIEMKQRASLRELRDVRDALMAALRAQITDPESLAELIEQAAGEDDPYEVVKLAKRVLSLPSQVTMFKDLIAAEKSVQDMERKAFRMDAEEQGSGIEALLERIGSRE